MDKGIPRLHESAFDYYSSITSMFRSVLVYHTREVCVFYLLLVMNGTESESLELSTKAKRRS